MSFTPFQTNYAANITKTFEMASEKQRNMMFYTKNMQINEKRMHFPREREVHRDRIIQMGTLPHASNLLQQIFDI